ncbi:uncharacterized protein FA14DRAFT_133029 [Meira miltonrushii]|uniref:GOLD domain-containing protein n=1 Tax=Meira miltonrushii TaxID=1280837 RepID=A0A316VBX0_9BASI|nr:uncharacterized protein FA14DRAFT_133029 [Meira miltonrushii]PWN35062.1 hypothetical protein FA14DRAFT_133029 [Meira miltonrushii]
MRSITTLLVLFLTALLSILPSSVQGAALTTSVDPHTRACFYAWVDKAGEKVGFYFAVQSGGSFDIEYSVLDPHEKIVVTGVKERQADLVFTGNSVGEYSFCFENSMSSFAVKIIDFDITVESEPRLTLPVSAAALLSEHSAPLEESISKVDSQLTQITRMQRYFRTWENRGFATVRQTLSKITWYSIIDMLVMIGVAVAQVYIVRYLFDKGSTKRYRV